VSIVGAQIPGTRYSRQAIRIFETITTGKVWYLVVARGTRLHYPDEGSKAMDPACCTRAPTEGNEQWNKITRGRQTGALNASVIKTTGGESFDLSLTMDFGVLAQPGRVALHTQPKEQQAWGEV
jgi:hypothetical protein